MRVSKGLRDRRWRRCLFSGALLLLGLAEVSLPSGRADLHYSGGMIQRHRNPPNIPAQTATPAPATPPAPPSYFPDSDFSYASPATAPPFGIADAVFPWNQPGFVDYNEPPQVPRGETISAPEKYSLEVTSLPRDPPLGQQETAVLIAHLPEQAAFWVGGARTRATGRTRYFQSPPLQPGQRYSYRVHVLWMENGQLVSQTRTVPVQAGVVQAIYLRPN